MHACTTASVGPMIGHHEPVRAFCLHHQKIHFINAGRTAPLIILRHHLRNNVAPVVSPQRVGNRVVSKFPIFLSRRQVSSFPFSQDGKSIPRCTARYNKSVSMTARNSYLPSRFRYNGKSRVGLSRSTLLTFFVQCFSAELPSGRPLSFFQPVQ